MNDLRALIETCVDGGGSTVDVADRVLKVLDKERLRVYADDSRLPLLSVCGKVFVAVLEDPGASQRSLASYLGAAESSVNRCLRLLVEDGVLVRERVDGRLRYRFDSDSGVVHPDVRRVVEVLSPLLVK